MITAMSPCLIGQCKIKNRFVMTAANLGWCGGGYVNDKVTAFYRERARGGVGLIIAGAAGIDPVRVNQTGMMQICSDTFIPGLTRLTREVHKEGSRIFLQLMHAGAYARQCEHGQKEAVAPSEYDCSFTRERTTELTREQIGQIVTCFGDAALRAKQAGFDGVELIGSAGYLIAEFLSGATNHREDDYGGNVENRARFLMEIIREVRVRTGENFPIIVRLSGTDFIPGGNGPEEAVQVGRLLDKKVDAINVTGGWHESQVPQITYNVPHGMYLYLAKAMKEAVSIPVIGCNRMNAALAQAAVQNGLCDMVGILRGFIADPYLVKKILEGREPDIRPCISCNQKCLEKIFSGEGVECVVNPFAGREYMTNARIRSGPEILVIGAGIAGMTYTALAAKNHRVTVWEKETSCGGAANVIARIPDREETKTYAQYLFRRCVQEGAVFEWNKEADTQELRRLLEAGTYDKIVIAAGSTMRTPDAEITADAPVISAQHCILGKAPPGRNIVVIGSNYKAVQTALYLAKAKKTGDRERTFLKKYAPSIWSMLTT